MSDHNTKTEQSNQSNQSNPTEHQTAIMMEGWKQLVDEQLQRLDGAFNEASRRHEQMVSQVEGAVDELSKLMKDSLALHTQLSSEWLKIARGTTARAGELMESMAAR